MKKKYICIYVKKIYIQYKRKLCKGENDGKSLGKIFLVWKIPKKNKKLKEIEN